MTSLTYRAQVTEHAQSTLREGDVKLVLAADADDSLVVRDAVVHFF